MPMYLKLNSFLNMVSIITYVLGSIRPVFEYRLFFFIFYFFFFLIFFFLFISFGAKFTISKYL